MEVTETTQQKTTKIHIALRVVELMIGTFNNWNRYILHLMGNLDDHRDKYIKPGQNATLSIHTTFLFISLGHTAWMTFLVRQ